MTPPKKLLAIKLRAMGDTVLMTAPLSELRRAFPEAEIHVAILSQWASLLDNHPAVDRIWGYEKHREKTARAKSAARLALRLREERFDCVINFHASPSSAMISRATGAKLRAVHFHGHRDKNRFSTVTIPGKGVLKPIIERDMDAVRALGIVVPSGRMPGIPLYPYEVEEAQRTLNQLKLPTGILGIGLGASRPSKSWPIENFAKLALRWSKKKRGVFAIAGPDEVKLTEQFMKALDQALAAEVSEPSEREALRAMVVTNHSLTVRQLAALLSQFAVFACNDSGPKHLAVAVSTPTVTLFGPEHPFEWHPYPRDQHPYFFIENLSCRHDAAPGMPAWCGVYECPAQTGEQHKCMRLIEVDPVLAECEKSL